MSPIPDFAVYSPDHKLQLVVEVKGTPNSDSNWAAKLRRNLLAHGAVPRAPYFLLVLPDYLYLWSHAADQESALPDFRADTREVLRRYLSHWPAGERSEPIGERGLELAVRSWLSELAGRGNGESHETRADDWLNKSGLAAIVRTGTLRAEPAL